MKKQTKQIVGEVEGWIEEQELPVKAGLKVVRQWDLHLGQSEEEVEAWVEFIGWHLRQDRVLLLLIPGQETGDGFYIGDYGVVDSEYSAFNTHDFDRLRGEFNRQAYARWKLLERVEELALIHSCISDEEGRRNTEARFKGLLEREFGERLDKLAEKLVRTADRERQEEIKRRIEAIRRQVGECERVWAKRAWAP